MVSEVSGNDNLVSNLQVSVADKVVLNYTNTCGIDSNSVNTSLLNNLGISGDNRCTDFS